MDDTDAIFFAVSCNPAMRNTTKNVLRDFLYQPWSFVYDRTEKKKPIIPGKEITL